MDENIEKAIEDIEKINKIIEEDYYINDSYKDTIYFLTEIRGRYSVIIKNFQLNLAEHYFAENSQNRIIYHRYNHALVKKDIHTIKGVLDSFVRNKGKLDFTYDNKTNRVIINNENTNINTNTNANTVLTEVKLDQVIDKISNNSNISQEEIDDILSKLSSIEEIANSKETKPKKWQKIKKITQYILDKGLDIGITVLPYILSIAKKL